MLRADEPPDGRTVDGSSTRCPLVASDDAALAGPAPDPPFDAEEPIALRRGKGSSQVRKKPPGVDADEAQQPVNTGIEADQGEGEMLGTVLAFTAGESDPEGRLIARLGVDAERGRQPSAPAACPTGANWQQRIGSGRTIQSCCPRGVEQAVQVLAERCQEDAVGSGSGASGSCCAHGFLDGPGGGAVPGKDLRHRAVPSGKCQQQVLAPDAGMPQIAGRHEGLPQDVAEALVVTVEHAQSLFWPRWYFR